MPTIGDTLDCGHTCEPAGAHRPGNYGTMSDGRTMCDQCIHADMLATIAALTPGDRFHGAYVDSDGAKVTTWTGDVLLTRVRWGKAHPWAHTTRDGKGRAYFTATDAKGRVWSGIGDRGMYVANLRLTKGVTPA
jgi:hypothetical protein